MPRGSRGSGGGSGRATGNARRRISSAGRRQAIARRVTGSTSGLFNGLGLPDTPLDQFQSEIGGPPEPPPPTPPNTAPEPPLDSYRPPNEGIPGPYGNIANFLLAKIPKTTSGASFTSEAPGISFSSSSSMERAGTNANMRSDIAKTLGIGPAIPFREREALEKPVIAAVATEPTATKALRVGAVLGGLLIAGRLVGR